LNGCLDLVALVLGDGSLTEGQVCEFWLTAAAYKFSLLSKSIETVELYSQAKEHYNSYLGAAGG